MSDISDDELDEAVTLLAMLGGSSTSRGSSRRSSGEGKPNERERERERRENERKVADYIQELDNMQKKFIEENSHLKSNEPYTDSAINVIKKTRDRFLDSRRRFFENAARFVVKTDLSRAAGKLQSTETFKAVSETLKRIIEKGANPPAPEAAPVLAQPVNRVRDNKGNMVTLPVAQVQKRKGPPKYRQNAESKLNELTRNCIDAMIQVAKLSIGGDKGTQIRAQRDLDDLKSDFDTVAGRIDSQFKEDGNVTWSVSEDYKKRVKFQHEVSTRDIDKRLDQIRETGEEKEDMSWRQFERNLRDRAEARRRERRQLVDINLRF